MVQRKTFIRILIGGFRAPKQRAAYCGKLAEAVVTAARGICSWITMGKMRGEMKALAVHLTLGFLANWICSLDTTHI